MRNVFRQPQINQIRKKKGGRTREEEMEQTFRGAKRRGGRGATTLGVETQAPFGAAATEGDPLVRGREIYLGCHLEAGTVQSVVPRGSSVWCVSLLVGTKMCFPRSGGADAEWLRTLVSRHVAGGNVRSSEFFDISFKGENQTENDIKEARSSGAISDSVAVGLLYSVADISIAFNSIG